MFIRKVDFASDLDQVKQDLETILTMTDWGTTNQIGLTHRPDAVDPWHDCAGSLYHGYKPQERPREQDFNCWNPLVPTYVAEQLQLLQQQENFRAGRVRFMRLLSRTGLSVHLDTEPRYHLVIKTNPSAYIGQRSIARRDDSVLPTTSVTYHMPADGNWYEVDTRQTHYVYNGGTEPRIHLVVCKL